MYAFRNFPQQFSRFPLEKKKTHAKCFGVAFFQGFFFHIFRSFASIFQHFACKLNDLYLFTVEGKELNSFDADAFKRKHALNGVFYVCSFDVCNAFESWWLDSIAGIIEKLFLLIFMVKLERLVGFDLWKLQWNRIKVLFADWLSAYLNIYKSLNAFK